MPRPPRPRAASAARRPRRPRHVAKQETREALLRAATELFAERGLDAPSLDDICDRAGRTRGAFYVHFRDRDALLTAVMERVGGDVLDALLGAGRAAPVGDLADIAHRFLDALATGRYPLTRAGGVRPYQLLDACARSPAIREQYRALVREGVERLARSLREGQRRHTVRADASADQVALLLMAVVIGAHTLLDLDVPIDLAGGSAALLGLLAPPGRSRRAR